MKRAQWSTRAVQDLKAARRFLQSERPDAAASILENIVRSTDRLLEAPAIGSPVGYRRWRKWRVRGTPYLLFYQPDPIGITVVHILHQRSDWWSVMR